MELTREQVFEIAYLIPGQMWPAELSWMYDRIQTRSAEHVVEVGTFCGKTLWVMAAALAALERPTKLVSVDVRANGISQDWVDAAALATVKEIRQHFPQVDVTLLRCASSDAFNKYTGKPDFVFVDADHHYAECSADIKGWGDVVTDDGTLCGHDYWAKDHGVIDAVNQQLSGKFIVVPSTRIWVKLNEGWNPVE